MKPHCPKILTLALVSAVLASSAAFAGYKYGDNVGVSDTARWAYGDLGLVRNSPDRTQMIGCYAYTSGASPSGGCYAQTTAGVYRSCYTADPNLLATIHSLTGDSHVTFYWDTSGRCSNVQIYLSSVSFPKT